jgi:hypothetical protein
MFKKLKKDLEELEAKYEESLEEIAELTAIDNIQSDILAKICNICDENSYSNEKNKIAKIKELAKPYTHANS